MLSEWGAGTRRAHASAAKVNYLTGWKRITCYRLLKAHDLITSPAYVLIKAADQFHTRTTRPNEMWKTDFPYFKIIGWGWLYLSTVLDDYIPLHHRLEAVYQHAGRGRDRDASMPAVEI